MSAATSPGTGLAYGLRRVCAAWGMARSSFRRCTPSSRRQSVSPRSRRPCLSPNGGMLYRPPPWRQCPMTVHHSCHTQPHVGHRAFGCSRWTTLGLDLQYVSTRDLHGACRAVWLERPARLAGLADITAPSISVGPLHQPDQVLGHQPSYAFVAEPQTNGVAERFLAR